MGIYYGHFSAMPVRFEPPRAGTMPKRQPAIPVPAALDNAAAAYARATAQSQGDASAIAASMDQSRKRANRKRKESTNG